VGGSILPPAETRHGWWRPLIVALAILAGVVLAWAFGVYEYLRLENLSRLQRWVARSPRVAKIDGAVARHGWRILAFTRLLLVFPFNMQNYAYGLSCSTASIHRRLSATTSGRTDTDNTGETAVAYYDQIVIRPAR
jgi:hypothetical protein